MLAVLGPPWDARAMPVHFAMHVELTATITAPVELDLTNEHRLRPLTQLMPPGIAWDLDPGSVLHRLLRALARVLGRFDTWLRAALRNLSPWTAEAELSRWERILASRPPEDASLDQRRRHAGARLRARGGQSKTYWRELLAGLGYEDVEVTSAGDPFRCGDRMGKRLQPPTWMFVLIIRAKSIPELDALAEALIRDGVRGSVHVIFEWK